jgi:acyl transferase domain-containing protein
MRRKDIAIVGLDCVFPAAHDAREYWRNIVNEVDCVTERPAHRMPFVSNFTLPKNHIAHIATSRGGYLPGDLKLDPLKYGVMPNAIKDGDPDQFLMLKVIDGALHDAGVADHDSRRVKTDLIIGRGGYSTYGQNQVCFQAEWYEAFLEMLQRRFPDMLTSEIRRQADEFLRSTLPENDPGTLSTFIPNIAASRAANRLNLGGTAHTVDAACASSLIAVEQAVDRLRSGRADIAVAGGFFVTQWPTFSYLFQMLGAISPSGMIRPMDRRADGLLLSEGGGAVVLKRLEDAIEDGDRIYAIVKGVGTSSDGRETDVLAPSSTGQVRALERAYADADIDRASIGYLELHGTGTKAGDATEIATVKQFYGDIDYPASARAMGSGKSMIGHSMPASGIASLIRVTMSLSNKVLPPTLHCEQPHSDLAGSPFYVNPHTRPWIQSEAVGPRRAGINSFGFGGANVHAVLEEVLPPKKVGRSRKLQTRSIENAVHRPSEVALFSAADSAGLRAKLRQLLGFLDADITAPELADVAAALSKLVEIKQPCKLALVVEDLADLRAKAAVCLEQLEQPEPKFIDEEIYYSPDASRHKGKIAFIFPGMGFPGLIGNYPDHLIELCLHDPDVRREFDFFEDRDRHPDDHVPTSSVFCPPASLSEEYRQKLKNRLAPPKTDSEVMYQHLPEERYLAAMGVTLANWVGWTILKKLNIPVDMTAGQSQGEMAALCAAGVCDFHGTAPAYWKALNVNPNYSARGRLCFVWAKPEDVQPHLDKHKDAYIAIHMAPHALILGGDKDSLAEIMVVMKKEGRLCQTLPYPPIHTPCLSYLGPQFDEALADMDFNMQRPKVALYSSITAEPYPNDPKAIRETLTLNVDHPLKIWQTIHRMYADGARVIVQVGGGHMSAHLKELLPGAANDVVTTALEVDTRNPITQLNHLVSTLFVAGVPVNSLPLYDHRCIREIDLEQPVTALPKPKLMIPVRMEWHPLASPVVPPKTVIDSEPIATESAVEPAAEPVIAAAAAAAQPVVEMELVPAADEACAETSAWDDAEFDRSLPVLGHHGKVVNYVPEQEILIHRPLNFEQDQYIFDHVFVYAPMRHDRENLAVVPMTMTMEFVAEAAGMLSPGLGLIGYEQLRASRWIALEDIDATTLEISAKVRGDDAETGVRRVEVIVEYDGKRAFSVTVLFAAEYRHDVHLAAPDLSGAGGWPFPVEEVYGKRRCFHGPIFQTVVSLDQCTSNSATATLVAAPQHNLFADMPEPTLLIDPCLFDACGQAVGLFCQIYDRCVLPTAVDRVEIYGPMPPAGTLCPLWLDVTEMNAETNVMRCNLILGDGQGGILAQFFNWTDWMFYWSPKLHDYLCEPHVHIVSTELKLPNLPEDAVCTWLTKDEINVVKFDWFPRTALSPQELRELRTMPKKAQQLEYVLTRLVSKDAARVWNQRMTGDRLRQTVELELCHEDSGRPYLISVIEETLLPQVTLSHTNGVAVAMTSEVPLGIDLEPADRDVSEILDNFATEEEQAALQTLTAADPDGCWPLRLWCAKESASKAQGTGLQGLPKRFQLLEASAEGTLEIMHTDTERRFFVQTFFFEDFLISVAQEVAPDAPLEALYDENAVIM